MRAGIGLVGLLITMAIILYLLAGRGCTGRSYLGTLADVKKEKGEWAQQIGGKDTTGRPFHESLTIEEWPETGALRGFQVSNVDPLGPAATHYALQNGDIILEIGSQDVGGAIINSTDSGRDFLTDGFARGAPLVVRRNGQEITLPPGGASTPGLPSGGGRPTLPGGLGG